jgi:hypothetical protein
VSEHDLVVDALASRGGMAISAELRAETSRRSVQRVAAGGWLVLRFLWDDVRHRTDEVQRVLAEAVGLERSRQAR